MGWRPRISEWKSEIKHIRIIDFNENAYRCYKLFQKLGVSISVIGENFKSFLLNKTFRSFVIGIIWSLELSIPVILAVDEKHIFNVKSPREWLYSLLTLILVFLSCTPIYAPQHLFGYTDVIFDAWTLPHIIWLVLVITEIITLYFVFRNKEEDIKRIMLFILSLSLLLQYNQMFGAISLNIARLPLQLCNIGSYLILIALMTKSKKIFDFQLNTPRCTVF